MAKKRKTARTGSKRQVVIDLTSLKEQLAVHIKTMQRIVDKREAKLKKAGGRGTALGKEIAPGVTKAKQMLNSMKAAQSAMYACCGCEPAQTCPFDI